MIYEVLDRFALLIAGLHRVSATHGINPIGATALSRKARGYYGELSGAPAIWRPVATTDYGYEPGYRDSRQAAG